MAQCPKCNGTGSVLTHLNPHDVNKVGAGMGMHRCDRCHGLGRVEGMSGSGGGGAGQLLGLIAIIAALFLHPKLSFVGFWLISTGLLISIAPLLNLEGFPNWYIFTAMGISVALAVLLRKFIPTTMKWIFIIAFGGLALVFVGGVILGIIESSASG